MIYMKINQEIKVGKSLKIDERVFYPIIKIFHWKHQDSESYSVFPVAVVVVEGEMKYIFPLEEYDEPEELETYMALVKPL
mgnify:CR=1 FL=1